jgi:S-adenosylhomocysteine hydrolase
VKDWIAYLKECLDTDLWGFVLLDYHCQDKSQRQERDPSNFIDEVLSVLLKEEIDPVAFHKVLLSVCVLLLGNDFSAIMAKSVALVDSRKASLDSDQLRSILSHYDVYGKREVFRERLTPFGFDIHEADAKEGADDIASVQSPGQGNDAPPVKAVKGNAEVAFPATFPRRFDQPLSKRLMKDPFRHTELLRYYTTDTTLLKEKPFDGKRVLFVLHFLKDLIPFVAAAETMGLDLNKAHFFYKDYPYPQKEAIRKYLKDKGANVRPRSSIAQCLEEIAQMHPSDIAPLLIVEDGGFIAPMIHRDFHQLLPRVVGAVEQTTRGIRNAEKWLKEKDGNSLGFPIISVATSRIKNEFEPPYIAEAIVANTKRLIPDQPLKGIDIALFGYGTIGGTLARRLKQDASVTIYDTSGDGKLLALEEGFAVADSPSEAVRNKDLVIGASGELSISSQVIANLKHGCYVMSTSSELYEIDIEELNRQQTAAKPLRNDDGTYAGTTFVLPPKNKEVHLIANGYPINFWGVQSMPVQASSLIMTLILLSAAELALGCSSQRCIDSDAVNKIADKYKVSDKFVDVYKKKG